MIIIAVSSSAQCFLPPVQPGLQVGLSSRPGRVIWSNVWIWIHAVPSMNLDRFFFLKGSWHDCSLISCLFVTFGYFWRVNTNCSDSSFSVWIRFAALTQWLSSLSSKLHYLLVCRNTTFAHRFSLIYPRCQLQGIQDFASHLARLKCSIKQCIFRKQQVATGHWIPMPKEWDESGTRYIRTLLPWKKQQILLVLGALLFQYISLYFNMF